MSLMMLDGGMGTELARRGWDVTDSLWSARVLLEHPEAIEQVHYDYLKAGADCVTTASYQVSFEGFAKAGLAREAAAEALARSVEVAKQARLRFREKLGGRREPLVAASLGPYGASLADGSEYHGNYACSRADLFVFHSARMKCLHEAAPDLLACETIPSLAEAEVLLEALWQFPTVTAWFSFACRDGEHTVHGEKLQDCVRALERERQVVAVGVNCTAAAYVDSLIRNIRAITRKPIVVYPNSGQTWNASTRAWEGEAAPPRWEDCALAWRASGAQWIGGCCGTTPEDIRRMRNALEKKYPDSFPSAVGAKSK